MALLWVGIEGPRSIPDWAWYYIARTLKDFPANTVCVERVSLERGELCRLIRIFDPGAVPSGVDIRDFISLDEHPELILYEGYREEKTGIVKIERMTPAKPTACPA